MDTTELYPLLHRHWAFRLFKRFPGVPYPAIALAVSALIFLVGALASLLVGAITLYLQSPLPYLFLAGLTLALTAHGWWMQALLRMLRALYPAFEITSEDFKQLVVKWDRHPLHHPWASVLLGLPLAVFNLIDILTLWASPDPGFVWEAWIHSPHALFFGLWYGLLHVGATGFVLGSGLAGLLASLVLIRTVLQNRLRLAHYRQLEVASAFGVGLSMWTFIALTAVFAFTRPTIFMPLAGATSLSLIISTVIQSVLASAALVSIFSFPLLMCRDVLKEAKAAYRLALQQVADHIYANLKQLAHQALPLGGPASATPADTFESLQKQLTTINALIKEIDGIPAWPISLSSQVQLFVGAAMPVVSSVLGTWLKGLLGIK